MAACAIVFALTAVAFYLKDRSVWNFWGIEVALAGFLWSLYQTYRFGERGMDIVGRQGGKGSFGLTLKDVEEMVAEAKARGMNPETTRLCTKTDRPKGIVEAFFIADGNG